LQLHLYFGDPPFAGFKRGRTRVHRVVSKHEVVRMAYGRTKNQFGAWKSIASFDDSNTASSPAATRSGTARLPVLSATQQTV
jgi:hypothetical protein